MATPIKETPAEIRYATRTSVVIAGPAHGGAGGKARNYSMANSHKATGTIRNHRSYLIRPCHDWCKHAIEHASSRSIRHKISAVTRTVVPVGGTKTMETKPSKKVGILKTNRKATQSELKKPNGNPTASVKPRPMRVNPSSSTLNASAGLNGRKSEKDVKTNKSNSTCVAKTASKDTRTGSLSSKPSVSRVVSLIKGSEDRKHTLKDQNRMTEDKLKRLIAEKVKEKAISALHKAVKESEAKHDFSLRKLSITAPVSGSSQSSPDKQVSKVKSDEEVQSSCDKEATNNNEEGFISEDDYEMETSEENHKKNPRNDKVVISEDKDDDAFRLKFRRGKVVERQSEDNSPRRLKFRQGRFLEEDDSNHGSESVTLKHQEMQEKKDAQELLNNVIEETASKLVEDMKTKVEALVGAFETVISLQDDNTTPSPE